MDILIRILYKLFDAISTFLNSLGEDKFYLLIAIVLIVFLILLYKFLKFLLPKFFDLFIKIVELGMSDIIDIDNESNKHSKYEKLKLLNEFIKNMHSADKAQKNDYKLLIEELIEDIYKVHITYHRFKVLSKHLNTKQAIEEYKVFSNYIYLNNGKFYWKNNRKLFHYFIILLFEFLLGLFILSTSIILFVSFIGDNGWISIIIPILSIVGFFFSIGFFIVSSTKLFPLVKYGMDRIMGVIYPKYLKVYNKTS